MFRKDKFANGNVLSLFTVYSLLKQSDGNSFCGNVVLDSVSMASRDDSILDQIYEKQIFSDLFYEDLILTRNTIFYTFLVINAVFIPKCHVKLSKTTSPEKKLFRSDCFTL